MPTIGGTNIGWDNTVPGNSESAGLGDGRIKSVKTSVQQALDAEHNFPAAGGANTGYHVFGSARPYYGPQSAVSSTGSDGRLMQASDTSRLFGVGSGGTTLIGGPTVVLAGSFAGTVPQRHYWAMDFGTQEIGTGDQEVVTFNSLYSGAPIVTFSAYTTTNKTVLMHLRSVGAGNFTVSSYVTAGGFATGHTINWQSIGSRVL